ncbi:hypothetical protein KGF57_003617 [Candida theae]|uniref:F-box domain-containing protein n=1 Tax=Candida theae TaxID=1198502 RepID=A0AAD5BCJ5_9ASCO|nr:uncharacterized protein KGF57_003597 [Candida theae]XP_051607828.1 uncharacterized protein KGF57_003617 [Candida theae]KAI5955465.1 hypothetical protein KGF57_003597 [Candida theae]KAI5955485.1 hypothetical protein KGF57_003617 [Candida theae]
MISLTSLPCEALEEVFHQLNQHYVVALAPLHSKFHYIAKPKLYRNIYVYSPWSRIQDETESNEQKQTFHISKSFHNLKSQKYSIISSDTFERYLAKMDKTQKIYHLELYDYHMTLIVCILRHFTNLRYVEFVVHYYSDPIFERVCFRYSQNSFGNESPGTTFIVAYWVQSIDLDLQQGINQIKIIGRNLVNQFDYIQRFKNLTKLKICMVSYENIPVSECRCFVRLQVLEVSYSLDGYYCVPRFRLSDVFETRFLQELAIDGDMNASTVFKSSDLSQEFPRLVQLCLRFIGEVYANCGLQDLGCFEHRKLRYLIMASHGSLASDAAAVCDLCAKYPNSSINWWYQPEINFTALLTHNFKVLSPNLPFGVVGYHFYHLGNEDLSNFKRSVTNALTKEVMEVEFKRCYTEAELEAMYDFTNDPRIKRCEH